MTAFISLGGNLGNTREIFEQTYPLIEKKIGRILQKSSLYQTAAWGMTDQADFINQVIEIETTQNPDEVLTNLLAMELHFGRIREVRWGPRSIDLDLLFLGNQQLHTAHLTLPHPRIQDRKFILIPLVEIAPQFIHPLLGLSTKELLARSTDASKVEIIQYP